MPVSTINDDDDDDGDDDDDDDDGNDVIKTTSPWSWLIGIENRVLIAVHSIE